MASTETDRSRRVVLVAMTLANAMILVDQTAVPLALPAISQDLRVGTSTVQWVLTGSLLPLAGLLILGGRVGDMFGRRRTFLLGSVVFAGASAVAGLAPSFGVLLAARVVQGMGGAMMLPATVSIVSATFPAADRGRALGTMGGLAAVAGALGPSIGGGLTSALSWRAVLLVNLPLLAVTALLTVRAVPIDAVRTAGHVDVRGAVLACVALVGLVFGLSQSTVWGWTSPGVVLPLAACVLAAVGFGWWESRAPAPMMDFRLLRGSRNYRAATASQAVGGMVEMGLGLIFPLLLLLNLRMSPGLAGLALLPSTVPMVLLAAAVGRWFDKVGGRLPLVVGFGALALSGVLLAAGTLQDTYAWLLPGLLVFGVGLCIVLTVNDPLSLDTIAERDHGQASGVSATAEQAGGAIGIALFYAVFHHVYVADLGRVIASSGLPALTPERGEELRNGLFAAEQTGLDPSTFDPAVSGYLLATRTASDRGYLVVFLVATVVALVGLLVSARLVRKVDAEDAVAG